jgi:uncharacterized DUF497 family protein
MLDFDRVEWDDAYVDHIADNGLGVDEVEDVLYDPRAVQTRSRSSGRPAAIGETATGKTIIVIYETRKEGNTVILRPVTAYEIGG